MNTEEDNDPQEVFVVGDYAEYNIEPNCNIPPDSTGFNAAFVFVLYLFAPMALVAYFSSIIAESCNIRFGDIGVPLMVATALIAFLVLIVSGRKSEGGLVSNESHHPPVQRNGRRKRSRKSREFRKFDNIEDYENSPEYAEDERIKNAQAVANNSEKIELATDALVSLGFKRKRASQLVASAIGSGIEIDNTQDIIRYCLKNNA